MIKAYLNNFNGRRDIQYGGHILPEGMTKIDDAHSALSNAKSLRKLGIGVVIIEEPYHVAQSTDVVEDTVADVIEDTVADETPRSRKK